MRNYYKTRFLMRVFSNLVSGIIKAITIRTNQPTRVQPNIRLQINPITDIDTQKPLGLT
jgi:hypothetical protein